MKGIIFSLLSLFCLFNVRDCQSAIEGIDENRLIYVENLDESLIDEYNRGSFCQEQGDINCAIVIYQVRSVCVCVREREEQGKRKLSL